MPTQNLQNSSLNQLMNHHQVIQNLPIGGATSGLQNTLYFSEKSANDKSNPTFSDIETIYSDEVSSDGGACGI